MSGDIIINGNYNNVLPKATHVEQNFYGDKFAEQALRQKEHIDAESLNDEEKDLYSYLQDANEVRYYRDALARCKDTKEVARIVSTMVGKGVIQCEDVYKAEFMEKLVPFISIPKPDTFLRMLREQIHHIIDNK